jgi:DNA-binding NarL/FixJ family response regulator
MIKVLIVDDQKTVQELLKSYLEQAPDLEIVGIASNGQIAIEQVEASRPDVILMDIEMPVIDGLTATKIIAEQFVETKILILSVHDTDTYLNKALQVGAKGYLLKNTPPEELIKAIYSVRKNYFQLGPGLLEKYLYKLASSGSNVTELDSLKVMVDQQTKLLDNFQNQSLVYQSKKEKNANFLNQQYFVLKREIYSLQYGQDKLKKQLDLVQSCFLIFAVVFAIVASVAFLVLV